MMQYPEYLKKSLPLVVLMSIDILLIVLHIISYFFQPFENKNAFSMERNDSYAETYQNIKWIIMIAGMLYNVIKTKNKYYSTWLIIFIFLFLEDVFRIHETIGRVVAHVLSPEELFTLRQRKIIELSVAAVIGIVLVAPVLWAYKKGSIAYKRHSADLLRLLIVLVFFGIVVDQVDRLAVVKYNWKPRFVMNIVEDGGEMLVASCIAAYIISMAKKKAALF